MHKALLDTSTLFDIRRAAKKRSATWAQNTLRHLLAYQAHYPILTISAFTAFELLDGLHRDGQANAIQDFHARVLPSFEVIYPDQDIVTLSAEINAALSKGQSIGIVDTLIAATAISRKLTLVNANTKHFPRVQVAGFPLILENWREA